MQLNLSLEEHAIVQQILQQFVPDYTVWAFGSRIKKGKAKPYSDLDLVLVGQAPLSLDRHAELAEAFDEANLNFNVDIVEWALTSNEFQHIIQENYIVLQTAKPYENQ